MHRKHAQRIRGILKKSQLSWVLRSEEEGWLSLARSGLVAGATHVGGGRWKSQHANIVHLTLYVEKPLNSKVIKVFVPELRSRYVFFVFRDSYVQCIYVMNRLCTFHISVSWLWCNGYRRRIWTRRHEFKSWTWLIAFHVALIPMGKVWIQLFSLQLWVNSRTD